jgi:hypothetical protein
MHDSIDVVEGVMKDTQEKGSTRIAAANMIQERVMGKATQQIEVGGNLIREMFERLDKRQNVIQTIDVSSPKQIEVNPKLLNPPTLNDNKEESEIDSWINEQLKGD